MIEPNESIEPRLPQRKMLLSICTVIFLDFLAFGMLIPVITPLVGQFSSEAFVVGLTFSAFAIGQFFVSPLLGALSDRYGFAIEQNAILFSYLGLMGVLIQGFAIRPLTQRIPERTLTIAGLGLMIVGYITIAIAPSVVLLYGSLTLSAVGFGLTAPTLLSSVSKGAEAQEQGFIIGANQSIDSLTLILSPVLAGLLFDRLGTGAPYWTGAILLSLAMLTLLNQQRFVKFDR